MPRAQEHRMRFLSRENFVTLLFALASAILAVAQTASPTPERDPRVEDLLRQMTLEEKAAQLSQLPGISVRDFIEAAGQAEDVIKRVGAGSVLWVSDPKEVNRLQHIAMERSRLHIPILFGLDVIHGYH